MKFEFTMKCHLFEGTFNLNPPPPFPSHIPSQLMEKLGPMMGGMGGGMPGGGFGGAGVEGWDRGCRGVADLDSFRCGDSVVPIRIAA